MRREDGRGGISELMAAAASMMQKLAIGAMEQNARSEAMKQKVVAAQSPGKSQ